MTTGEDLRGSTPIFTAKDVLIEVRDEVRGMKSAVDILVSQDLNNRVDSLERSRDELRGLTRISIALASLAAVASVVVGIVSMVRP